MIGNCNCLEELWELVHELNKKHFSENNLKPVLGGGKTPRPKFMFVFINPTARNISSKPEWTGPRFPFIGTKHVWRIFHKAGLLNEDLMNEIDNASDWSIKFTNKVLKFLCDKSFYFTNLVKWTGCDATLPDSKKINLFLPILKREIGIVKPDYVIAFGLIPFEKLAGRRIKLRDYYSKIMKNNQLIFYETLIGPAKIMVAPCYFPVGRGNPKKAVEILKLLQKI
ncbi:MAG: hypothetical protein GOU97_04115 [Nanoarchaeota archaeon]|nr:hypothetical protein [Nanoarchaeota archaeon]